MLTSVDWVLKYRVLEYWNQTRIHNVFRTRIVFKVLKILYNTIVNEQMLFRGISRDISRKMSPLQNAFSLLIFPAIYLTVGDSFMFPIIWPCNNRFHDSPQYTASGFRGTCEILPQSVVTNLYCDNRIFWHAENNVVCEKKDMFKSFPIKKFNVYIFNIQCVFLLLFNSHYF